MPTKYRIFFHCGSDFDLKTRVEKGEAWIDSLGLNIKGPAGDIVIKPHAIQKSELFRLHGLGRAIRVEHSKGILFLSVVRFMFGQFALVNFFRTGELHKTLTSLANSTLDTTSIGLK
jgi:hypothetical protein